MYRSGAALLIKLRHCFNKHNGKEQNAGNNAALFLLLWQLQNQMINDKASSTSK